MRYERVLLVNPPFSGLLGMGYEPNISLGYLSETLTREGVEHDVYDMAVGYTEQMLRGKMASYRPDLLGFTSFTLGYADNFRLASRMKEEFGPDLIAGGPHASCMREELMEEFPAVDYVVTVAGEQTLLELCEGKPVGEIKSLIYRNNGEIRFTGERRMDRNLDLIPFPRYEKFPMNRYLKRSIGMVTTRGCPYKCNYCPVPLTGGRVMLYRSPESVVEEISFWYAKGYKTFDFWDDNFTIQAAKAHAICDAIMASGLKGLTINVPNGIRADRTDRELLEKMKATGFRKISFGVEAGNDRMLSLLEKGEPLSSVERAIGEACELGFDVSLFFLIGSPHETMADVEDSFRLAKRYPVAGAFFYNIVPFPKTGVFDYVNKHGVWVKSPEEYLTNTSQLAADPVFYTKDMSLEERREAMRRAKLVARDLRHAWALRKFRNLGPVAHLIAFAYVNLYQNERFGAFLLRHRALFKAFEVVKQILLRERGRWAFEPTDRNLKADV